VVDPATTTETAHISSSLHSEGDLITEATRVPDLAMVETVSVQIISKGGHHIITTETMAALLSQRRVASLKTCLQEIETEKAP
jgi:hypothetical protein